MPDSSTSTYIYADKFSILINKPGVTQHITFLGDDSKEAHPEIPTVKKSDSLDGDKSIADFSFFHPILTNYLALHPQFSPNNFIADSAFDTIETYGFLKKEFHFSKRRFLITFATKALCLKSNITFTVIPPVPTPLSSP